MVLCTKPKKRAATRWLLQTSAAGTQAAEQLGLARGGDDDNVGYIYDVLRLI